MTFYAHISPDGELSFRDGDWRADVGPEGHNQVRLHPARHASGFVNDVGLLFPERYPRNIIGSLALVCMGAKPQPYAGPVVITGWDPLTEVLDLHAITRDHLPRLTRDIALVLDGEPHATPGVPASWAAAIAGAAHLIRTSPVEPARLTHLEES